MYAVIESGGKQYRVALGDRLRVETLVAEAGSTVELDKVLAVAGDDGLRVGTPHLEATTVTATVVGHGRGKKIRVFKMKRRKNYRRTQGHRQNFTELEITAIAGVTKPAAPAAGPDASAAAGSVVGETDATGAEGAKQGE